MPQDNNKSSKTENKQPEDEFDPLIKKFTQDLKNLSESIKFSDQGVYQINTEDDPSIELTQIIIAQRKYEIEERLKEVTEKFALEIKVDSMWALFPEILREFFYDLMRERSQPPDIPEEEPLKSEANNSAEEQIVHEVQVNYTSKNYLQAKKWFDAQKKAVQAKESESFGLNPQNIHDNLDLSGKDNLDKEEE